jgi:hypothetical protein
VGLDPAVDGHGDPAGHAGVAELTGQLLALNRKALAGYPPGMRVIVRRERPHPGAQLDLFEHATGWRYTAFATTTQVGQLAWLDARHRAHARVEDRILPLRQRHRPRAVPATTASTPPGSPPS